MSATIEKTIKDITNFYYLKSIKKIDCYFNNSSETDGDYDIYKFSKKFHGYPATGGDAEIANFYDDIIRDNLENNIKNIENKAQKVINNTKNITYGGKKLSTSLINSFKKYINKDFVEPKSQKESEFNYKIVPDLIDSINKLKGKLSEIKNEYSYNSILDKIPVVGDVYITTDIEGAWECSYGYHLQDKKIKDKTSWSFPVDKILSFGYADGKVEFEVPSKADLLKVFAESHNYYTAYGTKCVFNNNFKSPIREEEISKITKRIDAFIGECDSIIANLRVMTSKYSNMEKGSKKKYTKGLENSIKKGISKKKSQINIDQLNKKYEKLKLVIGEENAKKWLKAQMKKTGAKVSLTNGVISIASKKKKKKETKDNKKNKDDKKSEGTDSSGGNGGPGSSGSSGGSEGGALAATGATVAKTKSKKKKTKSKSKDKGKKKSKNLAVASAATIAAYEKTMQKKADTIDKIKAGTTNKIEQTKLNLNTKISQINSDRDANIANIESERDSNIADLYEQANNEINSIDPTDSDAKEQIASIKSDLESNINQANEDANAQIEEVKANAEQQISEANEEASTEIENIQKGSDKEINTIMENGLDNETTTGQDLETAADTAPTAKEVDQTNINDANSNKEQSASSLEKSRTEYNNNVSAKEINNPSNTQTEIESTGSEESSSSEEKMVYQQESNNSGSSESSNYSNYSSNEYNESNNSSAASSDPADVYVEEPETEIVETPAVPEEELGAETTVVPDNPNNEELTETGTEVGNSNSEIIDVPKKENKSNVAIPIGLGVAAAGAAAVAGVRFVKNRKQNDDSEETYDDENNNLDDYESGSDDSEYMKDDYLGPSGSMYTDTDFEDDELSEVPDDTKYNDAAHLEEQIEDDSDAFTEDEILNDLG